MRILMLLSDAHGGFGGIAKFNRDFLTAAAAHPATTEIVVLPRRIHEPIGVVPSKIRYRPNAAGGIVAFGADAARAALGEGPFGLIVAAHINLAPFAWSVGAMKRAPVALIVHGVDAWQPTPRALTNLAARRIRTVIAVSKTTLSRFFGWAGARGKIGLVLPNTVDAARFRPGPRREDLLDRYRLRGRTILMTLARLDANERYKGIDEVLGALPLLVSSVPNLGYLIVGDGSDRARLESEARRLGMDDRVVFAGRVSEDEKVDHYRLADAFVMPGRGEGFGIVYLEALACGVPVVGSVLDASRDALLDGRLGVLVDPDDRAALVAGIREALGRPKGDVPELLSEYSEERFAERVRAILDGVAAGGRSKG